MQKLQEQGRAKRVPEYKIIVDQSTYNTLEVFDKGLHKVSMICEVEQNDNKREIKIINQISFKTLIMK